MSGKFQLEIIPNTLHFKHPAGTSRGIYRTRQSWFLKLTSPDTPGQEGWGECAPLPDLSCDALPGEYEKILEKHCRDFEKTGKINYEALRPYPSMLFGIETAMLHFHAGSYRLFDTAFSRGEQGITINGLVWMGNYEEMLLRMKEKLSDGFHCIKIKIGAIDFEQEIKLLELIREQFSSKDVELRVDANCAFSPDEVEEKLNRLANFELHSIEQPIKAGLWKEMAKLCQETPVPIALDEELIGVNDVEMKKKLLDTISPHYIVLKPSLHGGLKGTKEWMNEANKRSIGSWVTSALESNIGLNAIAQWTAHYYKDSIPCAQGLGTGKLFSDNIKLPLCIKGDKLWYKE